jgi:2'-5' RNA ligase
MRPGATGCAPCRAEPHCDRSAYPRNVAEHSPVVSVELTLDAASDAAIRADWAALQDAGLSSAGAHPSPSNRPHLSLAVLAAGADARAEELREALDSAAASVPIRIRLSGLLLFPYDDRLVLARAVVPDAALLALHAAVDGTARRWGDALPRTRPGEWSPHLTVARRLRRDDLPRALELLGGDRIPELDVVADAIRIWDARERRVVPVAGS